MSLDNKWLTVRMEMERVGQAAIEAGERLVYTLDREGHSQVYGPFMVEARHTELAEGELWLASPACPRAFPLSALPSDTHYYRPTPNPTPFDKAELSGPAVLAVAAQEGPRYLVGRSDGEPIGGLYAVFRLDAEPGDYQTNLQTLAGRSAIAGYCVAVLEHHGQLPTVASRLARDLLTLIEGLNNEPA